MESVPKLFIVVSFVLTATFKTATSNINVKNEIVVDNKYIGKPSEPRCLENIRKNLLEFLKRNSHRQSRQDDGDDEDEEAATNSPEYQVLSMLSQYSITLPKLIDTLTELSGAVNQGLNGTDTPTIPSFIMRRGMEAVQFFQQITGGNKPGVSGANQFPIKFPNAPGLPSFPQTNPLLPSRNAAILQSNPGFPNLIPPQPPTGQLSQFSAPVPVTTFKPYVGQVQSGNPNQYVPSAAYEATTLPADLEYEYYYEEDFEPPIQSSVAPNQNFGFTKDANSGYTPAVQNISHSEFTNSESPKIPNGMSLWTIYKTISALMPPSPNVKETTPKFQFAQGPDAFASELLRSFSTALSNFKGPMANFTLSMDKPIPEVLIKFSQKHNVKKFQKPTVPPKVPKVPTGKPVFWMNMYYPEGLAVQQKANVTTTKPRRRKTIPTATTETVVTTTESQYYEEEDYNFEVNTLNSTKP